MERSRLYRCGQTQTRNAYHGCLAQIAQKVRATGAYLAAGNGANINQNRDQRLTVLQSVERLRPAVRRTVQE